MIHSGIFSDSGWSACESFEEKVAHFELEYDYMHLHQDLPASSRQSLQRHDLLNFIASLYGGDLHAKRVLSLANATLGVLTSASLAIHAVGRGLAQALGTLTKHGVKQVTTVP